MLAKLRNSVNIFKVPRTDLARVEMLLDVLFRASVWVAGAMAVFGLFSLIFGSPFYSWVFIIASIALGLASRFFRQLEERWSTSLLVNLYLMLVLLYTQILPSNLEARGIPTLLHAGVILGAALMLTPEAGLAWGALVLFVDVLRLVLASDQVVNGGLLSESLISTGVLTALSWLLGHSFRQAQAHLRQQIEQRQTGIEIGHLVTGAVDLPSVTRQTVEVIKSAFNYYHVGIYRVDPESGMAVLLDAAGEAASYLKETGLRIPLDGLSVIAAAVNQNRRAIVTSWRETRGPGGLSIQFTYKRLPTRMELAIPLAVRGEVLGVLDLHSTDVNAFPEEDIHVLEGIAGHIANALANSRLFDAIQRSYRELENLYAQMERRTRYLQATAELARAISAMLDQRELLSRAATLVSTSLGVYHTGIFLVDETGEWAVLVAANSEGGQRMLARNHKLRVGEQGIVGRATYTGQPYIGLDVGEDAVYFANPDLPDTRSEIALPLKVGGRVIGALDVQSTQEAAFGEEDIAVLQTVADQIAIAIENARLFQQTQQALEEMENLQRFYVAREWEKQRASRVAEYCSLGVQPLEAAWTPEMQQALEQGRPVRLSDLAGVLHARQGGNGGNGKDALQAGMDLGAEAQPFALAGVQSALAIPIKLRGETIGVLDLQDTSMQREWSQEDVEIATAVADQLALALENARLVEETRRRAAQLAAAQEVARDATSILEIDQLLDEAVTLISEQFQFYHAGVFLLDEKGEYAVLRAASSEGGKRMLARGHRLAVGRGGQRGVGIVGYVAGTGEPRIALDVGQDATFFNNPYLPHTRSEMGLPLKVHGQVIGVLDVQSTEEAAFSDEDVATLQTLADQLAAAIANARLFQEVRTDAMRRALINEIQQAAVASLNPDELMHRAGEIISARLLRPTAFFLWEQQSRSLKPVVAHDENGADVFLRDELPLTRAMNPALFSQVVDERRVAVLDTRSSYVDQPAALMAERIGIQTGIYVPLLGRDQFFGVLVLAQQDGQSSTEEMQFIEIVGANLSVALESAYLYRNALETAEQLKEMDRLKSQFLANMSHELRTPLNSIIGFSRVILKGIDGPLTDMQKTDLEAVYNSGQHLLELINSILDISKIQAGKMELSFEDTNLHDVIKVVMSTAIALVKDKPIELQQVVPSDLPIIRADPRRVRQILTNLVGNAAKFTERGFIRVEVEVGAGTPTGPKDVILKVADTGIGIPADKLDTIFEEFTQVDGSSTRAVGGTGLGLSITRHFVEMHGGRIWVESLPGVGSTFYVSLPIAGPSAPTESVEPEQLPVSAPSPAADLSSDQRVVLCVDDDEGVIMLFRRYLSKQGYQVVGITDSTTVIERARQVKPFAITLDVMMPQMDGWQVIQDLKSNPETRHIPVIVCSIVSDKDRGLSLGASDYLVKPVLEDDLLSALERLARERREHQRVLIVDDNESDRKLLRRMIESQKKYEAIEAGGGQEAIEIVRRVNPDVIILDLMMPEVDGFAVLESVKGNKATRAIPIIVVTAKDLTSEERGFLNHRVESLLQKGLFQQQELLADVAAALQRLPPPNFTA